MNKLFFMILTKSQELPWYKKFWNNLVDFFTRDTSDTGELLKGELIQSIIRFSFVTIIIAMLLLFFISGRFLKIVKEEMDKGGEEYGEIASTKVANKAYLFRVLAIVFLLIVVIGLFVVLAIL